MNTTPKRRLAACLALLAFAVPAAAGPLEDYVRAADPSFAWSQRERGMMDGLDVATLDLTSQDRKSVV